jgi:HTH-type transcriptional regulator / antitoxin HigA
MIETSGKRTVRAGRARFDVKKYGGLLAETAPTVIETERENRRLLKVLRGLMKKPDLTPEEKALAKLLGHLIQEFEQRFYKPRKPTPHEILIGLMEMNHLKPSDFLSVFGSSDIASEVISGKREISKAHAKALGKFFSVSADLFL